MKLTLRRISTGKESTLGALYIDGTFECFALEDTRRDKKVAGETRIPDGTYTVELRNAGGMTKKYAAKYPDIHKGMLWILGVPDFEFVYIHTGNKRGHTEGCLLVGDSINNNTAGDGFLGSSRQAYTRLYPQVSRAILSGGGASIEIINIG